MPTQPNLFLSQSYKDAQDDFGRSVSRANFHCWDYIILTASNENQAESFRIQIDDRKKDGILPSRTHFAVIPDPDGKRVGSGGATLGVIRYIAQQQKENGKKEDDFSNLRILVIHSGGDSKRVPQYSALGKLFSPVPHKLKNGRLSTLFDEFLIATASIPSRIKEGMLLLSGDVLLLFNPLQIDFSGNGAAAISFKEDVETGKNHGVFLRGDDGNVKRFLHKQSIESLNVQGAVNERGKVDIDTGAVIFSKDILTSLYGLISENGIFNEDKFYAYVNEKVRLSLYGDFIYPLASDSTLDDFYKEKPEGDFCEELLKARENVWKALSLYRLKLLRLAPAKFIHFGTSKEILDLMSGGISDYSVLDWNKQVGCSANTGVSAYNSIIEETAKVGESSYIEVSYIHSNSSVGNNSIVSYVDVYNKNIPDDVIVHGIKQKDGKFVVRIYGVHDNPKDTLESRCSLFGVDLKSFIDRYDIKTDLIWDSEDHSLWKANLYPCCDTIQEALDASLNFYNLIKSEGNFKRWTNSERKSLYSGFNDAEPYALLAWDKRMQELVRMDMLFNLIVHKKTAASAKEILKSDYLTNIQKEWFEDKINTSDYSMAMRLNYYTGMALGGSEREKYISECFKIIQGTILESSVNNLQYNDSCKIITDKHTVKLPLRVNWGGGWSDTPPYCNENGGTVLNCALALNGELPVEVTLEKIKEHKIIFESKDMDVYGEFDNLKELQNTGDPYDSFALQKAALVSCGIIPKQGGNLEEIFNRLGGGFKMNSEVTNVPKGSGLGTSSILSGACVKAIFEFMGIDYTEADLYSHVLCMEQIMATGGGWQDQVGGLSTGIKYITTLPGVEQSIKVEHINIAKETLQELNNRFVLIYTGQRRLARNLLRDVVGRYIGNEPDSIYALNEIQRVAALMKFELERGHVDDFASLLDYHWDLSKMIDEGSTNTLIDQIYASIDDMICGKLVSGAGGGGFLQAILKKGVSKQDIHNRLKEVFQDSDIDVWDAELI